MTVVPQLADGRRALLLRFRYTTTSWSLEFPRCPVGGDLAWKEPAEDWLLETLRLQAAALTLCGAVHVEPQMLTTSNLVAWAENCAIERAFVADPNSLVAGLIFVTPANLDELILSGDVHCGASLAALTLVRCREQRAK